MRILKTKLFAKWAKKNSLKDDAIKGAALEILEGKFEANLGGNVIKKRIAKPGRGKRCSSRTIVAFKKGSDCFFLYGFDKKEKANVSDNEEKALKAVAKELLNYTDDEINTFIKTKKMREIKNE